MSGRIRRSLAAGLLLAVVVAGTACSVERTLPLPDCEDGGSVLIVAQSVPTASQVPCLNPLPTGWSVDTVLVNERHTVVKLDSDRAGDEAATLRLEPVCDLTGAIPVASDLPPTDRYDLVAQLDPSFEGARFYVFDGGCVVWEFDFARDASATEAVAIADTLVLVSRQEFVDTVRDIFVDEDF